MSDIDVGDDDERAGPEEVNTTGNRRDVWSELSRHEAEIKALSALVTGLLKQQTRNREWAKKRFARITNTLGVMAPTLKKVAERLGITVYLSQPVKRKGAKK